VSTPQGLRGSMSIVTVKLDDDDAINPNFVDILNMQLKSLTETETETEERIISFTEGLQLRMNDKSIKRLSIKFAPDVLTLITPSKYARFNIYHPDISNGRAVFVKVGPNKLKTKVTFDKTPNMYVMSDHNTNHSMRGQWDNFKSSEVLPSEFSFLHFE
jgi:hypothetical protein